jgi:hypothetical protein
MNAVSHAQKSFASLLPKDRFSQANLELFYRTKLLRTVRTVCCEQERDVM